MIQLLKLHFNKAYAFKILVYKIFFDYHKSDMPIFFQFAFVFYVVTKRRSVNFCNP